MLFLSGCTTKTETLIIRDVPDALIADRAVPIRKDDTNSGLLFWALELRSGLIQSNDDKAAIRKWKLGEQK